MKDINGIAVLFPGIGYTCDKPLLYYSEKLVRERGYEVVRVPYGGFPPNVKGDAAKMYQCFVSAREQTEDILASVDWSKYTDILFFSKSVGTVVARFSTRLWQRPSASRHPRGKPSHFTAQATPGPKQKRSLASVKRRAFRCTSRKRPTTPSSVARSKKTSRQSAKS